MKNNRLSFIVINGSSNNRFSFSISSLLLKFIIISVIGMIIFFLYLAIKTYNQKLLELDIDINSDWFSGKVNPSLSKVVEKAEVYAKSTCYARDLINHPPNLVDPSYLAHEARKLSSPNLKVTVFGKKELK